MTGLAVWVSTVHGEAHVVRLKVAVAAHVELSCIEFESFESLTEGGEVNRLTSA